MASIFYLFQILLIAPLRSWNWFFQFFYFVLIWLFRPESWMIGFWAADKIAYRTYWKVQTPWRKQIALLLTVVGSWSYVPEFCWKHWINEYETAFVVVLPIAGLRYKGSCIRSDSMMVPTIWKATIYFGPCLCIKITFCTYNPVQVA